MASQAKSTVFEGEAPESDEEDLNGLASYKSESSVEALSKLQTPETPAVIPDGDEQTSSPGIGELIYGEAPESDDETMELNPPLQVPVAAVPITSPNVNAVKHSKYSTKYNSLLHRKLRETNGQFKHQLELHIAKQYGQAAKNLKTISQQMDRSHAIVQEVSNTMRFVTNGLFHLEDRIDIISSCELLPNIDISPITKPLVHQPFPVRALSSPN